MPRSPGPARGTLLLVAEELGAVHAEVGAPWAHDVLSATLELLAHTLVDLADGRTVPRDPGTVPTPGPATRAGPGPDRASCAAAAAHLRSCSRRVEAATGPPVSQDGCLAVVQGLTRLADALQDAATAGRGEDPDQVRAQLHRALAGARRRAGAPGTVHP